MISLFFIEMLQSVAQGRARHGRSIFIQKLYQLLTVLIARETQSPSIGFMDQVFLVVQHKFSKFEGVIHVFLSYEIKGGDNCSATFRHKLGTRKFIKNFARLVEQITPHNPNSTTINQVPGVDAVMSADIQTEQFFSAFSGCLL